MGGIRLDVYSPHAMRKSSTRYLEKSKKLMRYAYLECESPSTYPVTVRSRSRSPLCTWAWVSRRESATEAAIVLRGDPRLEDVKSGGQELAKKSGLALAGGLLESIFSPRRLLASVICRAKLWNGVISPKSV